MIVLPLFPQLQILLSLFGPFAIYALWRCGLPHLRMTDPAQRSRMLELLCLMPLLGMFIIGIHIHRHFTATTLLHSVVIGFGPIESAELHRQAFPSAPLLTLSPFHPLLLLLMLPLVAHISGILYALAGNSLEYIHAWKRIRGLPAYVQDDIVVLRVPGWTAFTFGLLRPRIYLSEAVWLSPHRPAVVAHERSHARRRDPLNLFLCRGAERMLWYLPFWRHLTRQIEFEAELACDLRTCRVVGRAAYARALLAFADQAQACPVPSPLLTGMTFGRTVQPEEYGLLARVRALAESPEDATPRGFWPLFLLLYVLLLILF